MYRHSQRREFRLLEAGAEALAMRDGLPGRIVEPRAKARERLEFLALCVGKAQVTSHGVKRATLRLATDA